MKEAILNIHLTFICLNEQRLNKENINGVVLDLNDLSDSYHSLFKIDDEKSDYVKSQTFKQNKDLGAIPNEFKQKIYELKKTAMIYEDLNKNSKESIYSQLPFLGENCSGSHVKKTHLLI